MVRDDSGRAIRVLIIDDDRDIRETLGELLADEGFAVEAAWNGETALARLEAGFRPDVIVLDIMMPVMDGMAFRALQRKHAGFARIPVIGLTAFPTPAGVDFDCMRKPVHLDRLIERIHKVVAARPAGD